MSPRPTPRSGTSCCGPPAPPAWKRTRPVRIAVAGAGAFGLKHLDALAAVDGVTVTSVISRRQEQAEEVARKYGVDHASADLGDALARDDVDAVILCTPTQLHARQAIAALRAGKHVQVEIPLADSWADAREVDRVQRETGLTCMAGHTRRFNPSHQWIHRRVAAGELSIQQMDVQTYFFRRTTTNALGQPRSWTDHLLWHHAAHTVDLFQYQTGADVQTTHPTQRPPPPPPPRCSPSSRLSGAGPPGPGRRRPSGRSRRPGRGRGRPAACGSAGRGRPAAGRARRPCARRSPSAAGRDDRRRR